MTRPAIPEIVVKGLQKWFYSRDYALGGGRMNLPFIRYFV